MVEDLARRAGLAITADVIGFPISWITTYSEVERLRKYVELMEIENVKV
jgi:hypothetical protein